MTIDFKNVYINYRSTVAGPYEKKGPLGNKFDKTYNDLYNNENSWEKAEVSMLKDSLDILLKKAKKKKQDIDLVVSGDLLNQIATSSYAVNGIPASFLGIYGACSTYCEGIIISSVMIDNNYAKNCISATSSHNMSSEKQFRNPTEYGAPKPKTATFTATGGACLYFSNEKDKVKVESATIGEIVDMGQNDPLHMGAAMAPAAAKTIFNHLQDKNRTIDDYDLILTGDLGLYGKEILIDYMKSEYGLDISSKYNDCGTMLYNLNEQKEVLAGGSGPVCSALVSNAYILKMLEEKRLNRILLVATGALFNPTFVYQKENILAIAHAVSLEAVK